MFEKIIIRPYIWGVTVYRTAVTYIYSYVINNHARMATVRQIFNPIPVLRLLCIADSDKSFRIKVVRRRVRDRSDTHG